MVAGIQTAAVATGNSGGEEYNGTAWTETGDLNTTRHSGGMAGTQTDAIYVQGRSSPSAVTDAVETYNGTSWSSGTAAPNSRYAQGSCGATSNAYLGWGGSLAPPSSPATYSTGIEWNGSSWTASGSLTGFPAGRQGYGGVGIQTAALSVGGQNDSPGTIVSTSEEYNGSSWTSISSTPTVLNDGANWGTTTSAIASGGYVTTYVANTIAYDGSTWADLPSSTDASSSQAWRASTNGTSTTGLMCGNGPVSQTVTLEWTTASPISIAQEGQVWYNSSTDVLKGFGKSVSLGAWASGPAVANPRPSGVGQGTATAALIEGGGNTQNTESFDGTSWTEVNNLLTGRTENSGAGTQTAALYFGGNYPPGALNEEWDGTSWSEKADLTYGRYGQGGSGTVTAAICVGGERPGAGYRAETEIWDGTSWSEKADLNTARAVPTNFGTTTASICSSGQPEPAGNTESWDGTAWTEVNNQVTGRKNKQQAGFGIQTLGMVYGGNKPAAYDALTETWDGTSWSAGAELAQARAGECGAGTMASSALAIAGYPTPAVGTSVEVWSLADAIQTFTSS